MTTWFASLPSGWEAIRLDRVARAWPSNVDKHSVEGQPPVRLCNYTDVYKNAAITGEIEFMQATASPEQLDRFRLQVGDTLLTKDSETADDIGIPAFVETEADDLICGYHLAMVRPDPKAIVPKYLYWALLAEPTMRQWSLLATGVTRVGIKSGDLSRVQLASPDLHLQQRIADYLDRETAQIDTLIAEQQHLIDLLRERQEAEVRTVLTQGMGVAGPLKDATAAGLGTVPKHWDLVPSRFLATISTGDEDSGNADLDGRFPFFVRGREILRINRYTFDGEAVLTPGDGQGGTGKVFHYTNGKFTAHQRVYVFTNFRRVTGRYFYYFLSTFLRPVALAGSNTVTMESLRRPLLADFKVAVPPLEEQTRIVDYLDGQQKSTDGLVVAAERLIELARERRSALITAAVTGQIEIPEAS